MSKLYKILGSLIVFVGVLLPIGSYANTSDTDPLKGHMQALEASADVFQSEVGAERHACPWVHVTSYYDDLVDHYEQGELMRDQIDAGIR